MRFNQARHSQRSRRFARSAFSNNGEGFAFFDGKGDVIDRIEIGFLAPAAAALDFKSDGV